MWTNNDNVKVNTAEQGHNPDLDQSIAQVMAAAHPVIDQFSQSAHQTVDRLAKAAVKGADQLDAGTGELKAASQHWRHAIDHNIQRHPLAALTIAVATGFAVSWLLKSRVG
jgi:ElaB/YqjD/DUF883 family membrane-anchored ribosome-binding protein